MTFGFIFGGALWFHVMKLMFGPENAFVYAMMELAAILIAGVVWFFWNLISPEREEEEKPSVKIELVGKDLFKYEGDRIERLGPMQGVKDWMAPLMTKEDWDECMDAIENRNRAKTIEKLARQIDYREAQKAKEVERVTEIELRHNYVDDAYELVVRYERGGLECIDSRTIMNYGGIENLERRLGPRLRHDVELMIRHENGRLEHIDPEIIMECGGIGEYLQNLVRRFGIGLEYKDEE